MRPLLIDASVFVSAVLESDVHHRASREFFKTLRRAEERPLFIVPATVVLEMANVLTKFGKHRQAASMAERFPILQTVAIDDTFITQAIPVLQKVRLKTADATVAISAFLHNATLVSWDRQLLREARRIVSTALPDQYIEAASAA